MSHDSGGYQSYPFVAQLYDQITPYKTRPDIDFYVQAALDAAGPVL